LLAEEVSTEIRRPPADPENFALAIGCSDRTFTGTGFDMSSIALLSVRLAVQTVLRHVDGGYPDADYDYVSWVNVKESGVGWPQVLSTAKIPRVEACTECQGER
jgi:hypothetical protein